MLVACIVCGLSLPVDAASEGKLQRVRESTSGQSRAQDAQNDSQNDSQSDGDDDAGDQDRGRRHRTAGKAFARGFFGSLAETMVRGMVKTLIEGSDRETPEEASEETDAPSRAPRFAPYPYAGGFAGNLFEPRKPVEASSGDLIPIRCPPTDPRCLQVQDVETCVEGVCYRTTSPVDSPPTPYPDNARYFRLRLDSEGGTDLEGLARYGLGFWLESVYFVGLEGRFSHWFEPLGGGQVDSLILGDVNGVWRALESRSVQFHLGMGLLFSLDPTQKQDHAGLNTTAALEAYPVKPLSLRGVVDAGQLGDATVLQSQATLGWMFDRVEVYAGYRALWVGPVELHGPLAGTRIHL